MRLETTSFEPGEAIPGRLAFAVPADPGPIALSSNRNPGLRWSDVPTATRSFALLVHDPDVPSRPDHVNQPGRTVPIDLPRVDFFHWVLVDIPATLREIEEGVDSSGVTPRGKAVGATGHGRRGKNDYTGWFAGDAEMEGVYGGYDGPCPPWNDERLHHYVFTLYALEVESLDLPDGFGGHEVRRAIEGHVLAEASLEGTYTLNREMLDA